MTGNLARLFILMLLFTSLINIFSEIYSIDLRILLDHDHTTISFQAVNISTPNMSGVGNITVTTTEIVTVTFTYTPEPITITRPPTGSEIGLWLSGGIVIGLFIGAGIGYAIFAQGVTIKRERRGSRR